MGENPGGKNPEEEEEHAPETQRIPAFEKSGSEDVEAKEQRELSRRDEKIIERGLEKLVEIFQDCAPEDMPNVILLPDTSGRDLLPSFKPVLDALYDAKGLERPKYEFILAFTPSTFVTDTGDIDEAFALRDTVGQDWSAALLKRLQEEARDRRGVDEKDVEEMQLRLDAGERKQAASKEREVHLGEQYDGELAAADPALWLATKEVNILMERQRTAQAEGEDTDEMAREVQEKIREVVRMQKESALSQPEVSKRLKSILAEMRTQSEESMRIYNDEITGPKNAVIEVVDIPHRRVNDAQRLVTNTEARWHQILASQGDETKMFVIDDVLATGKTFQFLRRSLDAVAKEDGKKTDTEFFAFIAMHAEKNALTNGVIVGSYREDDPSFEDFDEFDFRKKENRGYSTVSKNVQKGVQKRESKAVDWQQLREIQKESAAIAARVLEKHGLSKK